MLAPRITATAIVTSLEASLARAVLSRLPDSDTATTAGVLPIAAPFPALALRPSHDVRGQADVPDVPDAASDSLNATPVLKLSYHLSPQRKQLQGCHGELLSPATDDLASTDR